MAEEIRNKEILTDPDYYNEVVISAANFIHQPNLTPPIAGLVITPEAADSVRNECRDFAVRINVRCFVVDFDTRPNFIVKDVVE